MFARMATFDGVDLETAGPAMESVREKAEQILMELPGWRGAMQMIDRRNNRVVVMQLFDSEENMDAAEPTFEEMPERLGPEIMQQLAGRRRSVDKFEVLAERRV